MYTENQIQIFVIISSIFIGLFILTTIYLIIRLKLNSILLRQSEEKIKEYNEDLEKMVKERTKQLSKSEESYKQLYKFNEGIVENSPAGIIRLDEKLKISYENPEMKRILGIPHGEESKALGLDIRELSSVKNIGVSSIFNNLMKGEEIATENLFISVYGKKTYITLKGVPMFENNKFKGAVLLINDITEHKQAEEEMQKLAAVVKHSSELVNLSTLDGRMTFLNEFGGKMLGIEPHEVENVNIMEVIPDHLIELVEKELLPALMKGETWEGDLQYRNMKTDELTSVHAMTFTVNDPDTGEPQFLANVSLDITERKRAEETQKTLYNISNAVNTVDNLHELFIEIREFLGDVIDTTNFYVAFYDEKTDMISLPFDVDEKDDFETFPAGKTLTKYVIKTGKSLFVDDRLLAKLIKEGKVEEIGTPSLIWLGVPLKIENKVIGVIAVQSYNDPNLYTKKDIGILTFIAEEIALAIKHKQADEQIRRDLKEKELLLSEIHHRVKNNLQVISGLLMLQENEITTKEDMLKGFAASQDRILAMAKAYELLLGSEYMSEVSVGKYIESLAEQLKHNYDIHEKVNISYSLDEFAISIEILDRLGLILNEIITNSIKHAFEGRDSGNIHIELKETEKNVVIKISDDGIGMPEDIDMNTPETLGLSLVEMLMLQLRGTLSIDRKNGTSFTLVFPKKI